MEKIAFRRRIHEGRPPIGTLVTIDSAEVVEALALCGFDWLFIDMEHGALDLAATQRLVRAAGAETLVLVRVPTKDGSWIRRVLDTGCDGIIVPLVRTAEEARAAVEAARYPPHGHRSVGIARAHGYGLRFAEYVRKANEQVSVVVQIEHIDAVHAIGSILGVEGIDAVLIGPYDLSGSMNLLGDVRHPEVQAAIATVRERCRDHGMPWGIFVVDPADAAPELEQGAAFVAVGTDLAFMIARAREASAVVTGQPNHGT